MKRIALLFLILPVGCVGLTGEYPDKRFYVLEARRSGDPNTPAQGAVLEVRRFKVGRRYQGNEFVYRMKGTNYQSDFYNQFFAAPYSMLAEESRRWLADAAIFEHVVPSTSVVDPTHLLEATVNAVYGDYREKEKPKAVMEIQFFLVDDRTNPPTIVFRKDYRLAQDLKDDSAEALVLGWNQTLRKILRDLESDLSKLNLSESE